jgi:hexokinase
MDPTDRAKSFLSAARIYHGDVDADESTREFMEEMEAGLQGRPSSLHMIPTFIEVEASIPAGEAVIAMDAGGTNLRTALVQFDAEGEPHLSDFHKHRMPGLDGEIPADRFFEILAGHVRKLTSRASRVGLSFSYPAEILPTRDGRILSLSKELRVADVEGQLVGERLRAALQAAKARADVHFVVLNDTVGALLAGRAAQAGQRFSRFVGQVLGTGLNSAYVESNGKIPKRTDLPAGGRQIINVEAGGYTRVACGEIDRALDADSKEPGTYLLEKAVSGAYLGALCLRTLQAAAEGGLFSQGGAACLRACPRLETPALDPFLGRASKGLHAALAKQGSGDDAAIASALVDLIVERAAKLAAVSMAAALLKSVPTGPADGPACLTVDGSTFYLLPTFRERITGWIDRILAGRLAYRVVTVDNAALVGAAVGGITN